MLPDTLIAPAENCRDPRPQPLTDGAEAISRIEAALVVARQALENSTAQGNVALHPGVRQALRALAGELMRYGRPNRNDAWVAAVLDIIKATIAVGGQDLPAATEDVSRARANLAMGWVGLLSAMLQTPSWQLPEAPALVAVPNWLWGDYVGWLFAAPPWFSAAGAESISILRTRRTQDLEHWVARNPGAASVRTAVDSLLAADRGPWPRSNDLSGRQQAESRGRIFSRIYAREPAPYEPPIVARHGRRLRVGFIARDFGPGPDVFAALPSFEQIDPKAFEVYLFPLAASETPEAAYCSRRARGTQLLPEGTASRVELLRKTRLDVVVFVGDLSRSFNDVAELALHRIAPLQAVSPASGLTSGLPEIDLFISGSERSSVTFTERIGVLRGPAHSLAFARSTAGAETTPVSREDLGLPVDRTVIAAVVDAAGAPQSSLRRWIQILARNEHAHLAIAFVYYGADAPIARFCSGIERDCAEHGVDKKRVTVFPTPANCPHETRALFSSIDLYVDAFTGGLDRWAAAEALRAGVPVVTAAGQGGGASAAMLASLGLAELVAADATAYESLVSALVSDAERRAALRGRIAMAMEAAPDFLDSQAASDAFAALIEAAFDELASLGCTEFRRQTDPVRCFSVDNPAETIDAGLAAHASGDLDTAAMEASLALRSAPSDPRARHLMGLVLHSQGNLSRAVDYLVAAVQPAGATPAMWYALALALRDNQQIPAAIQTLETCLRLDPRNVEVLLTLLELAERVGATEIAREVLQCLQQVAPDDPRVLAMS